MSAADAERARTARAHIRHILLKRWDPLTIQDIPECADEYDAHIEPLFALLAGRPPAADVAAELLAIEERMGIAPIADAVRLDVAERLLRLDVPGATAGPADAAAIP